LPFGPEVGAVCGKAARTDLRGGREVTRVPTAKRCLAAIAHSRCWHNWEAGPAAIDSRYREGSRRASDMTFGQQMTRSEPPDAQQPVPDLHTPALPGCILRHYDGLPAA
jgi:hypothetical protein